MSYRIRRTDANQTAIVKRFRQYGCTVLILSEVGRGCPDILVGFQGWSALVEIKDGSKPPSARKLTPDEQIFHDGWQGELYVISTEQEVDDLIAKIRGSGV